MALRYPIDVQNKGTPFVLFTAHRAKYKNGARELQKIDSESVALYMPPGFQVNDVMRYESASPGLAGGVLENAMSGNNDYSTDDLKDIALQGAGAATQAAASAIGGAAGGAAGAAVSGVGSQSAGAAVQAVVAKEKQQIISPKEFMLFKAPGIRQFSFQFTMIPRNARESDEVVKIIQLFREKMYPTIAANDLMYNFPEVFTLSFKNIDGIPKIAESALTNSSVQYNPNTMSYFKRGNRPVEIQVTLSFQELMALTQENIKAGF